MPPKQTDPQFKLRLPAGLKTRIEAAAQGSERTVSGEIISRLEDSFRMEELRRSLTDQRETFVRFLRAVATDDRKVVEDMLEAHKHFLDQFTRDDFWTNYVVPIAGTDDPTQLHFRVEEANRVAKDNGLDVVVSFTVSGKERSIGLSRGGSPVRQMVLWDIAEDDE